MSLQYAVELMLKRRNQDPLWLYKKIKSLQNVPGVYKRYIRLIRLLQEKGIPVKPVSYEQFRKAAKKNGNFAYDPADYSGVTPTAVRIDEKKAFFAALAAQIIAAPYAFEAFDDPGHIHEKKHGTGLVPISDPKEIPFIMGELSRRSIKDRYAEEGKNPPPDMDMLPKWVEKATKVLEEFFENDPDKAIEYILQGEYERAFEEEIGKMYRDLLFKAEEIKRASNMLTKETTAKELKPPKAVNIILSKLEAVREQA